MLDEFIARLRKCIALEEHEVKQLCDKAREILVDESNVQRVDAPVTVRLCACARWLCRVLYWCEFHAPSPQTPLSLSSPCTPTAVW